MTSVTFIQTYLYPTVFIMVAAWIVSRAGSVLIKTRLFGLWDRLTANAARMANKRRRKLPAPPPQCVVTVGMKPEAAGQITPMALPIDETARPRRRREPTDYSSAFLRKREASPKRQTYIGAAHFAKITEILAVLSPEVSVPAFLDNLIEHHLEQHRDEINALYADKFKKPL